MDDLSKQLGLTSMCVRQHLAILERDQLITSQEQRQKVGRPRLLYTLTSHAEALFPKSYHHLLEWMLDEIKGHDGTEKAHAVYDRLAERIARQLQEAVGIKPLREKVAAVCEEMNSTGSLAEWEEIDGGFLVREYNCRYHSVALKHPDLCRIEQSVLTRVLGADVKMVECLLRDSTCCTYFIRPQPIP